MFDSLFTTRRLGLMLSGALLSCGASNDYAAAGAGLGTALAYSAVQRAATGSCWANCAKGWYCDRNSGLCVQGECDPACPEGRVCVKEATGTLRCVVAPAPVSLAPVSPSNVAPDAGAGRLVATPEAGLTASARRATSAHPMPCNAASAKAATNVAVANVAVANAVVANADAVATADVAAADAGCSDAGNE